MQNSTTMTETRGDLKNKQNTPLKEQNKIKRNGCEMIIQVSSIVSTYLIINKVTLMSECIQV